MATQVITNPAQVKLASIDLSGYDPEQSRLMEERCIVVDENDQAVGCADKKTCMFLTGV
jgi:isopentenyl-diphosphate delta-isomerase